MGGHERIVVGNQELELRKRAGQTPGMALLNRLRFFLHGASRKWPEGRSRLAVPKKEQRCVVHFPI